MRTLSDDASAGFFRAIRMKFVNFDAAFTLHELTSRSWASVTFSGARHRIDFSLEGAGAGAAADAFLGGLADEEFDLRGHIVADISLVSEDRSQAGTVRISLEALTVEDN